MQVEHGWKQERLKAVKELTPLLIQQIYSVNTLAPYKVAQVTGQREIPAPYKRAWTINIYHTSRELRAKPASPRGRLRCEQTPINTI